MVTMEPCVSYEAASPDSVVSKYDFKSVICLPGSELACSPECAVA